MISDRVASPNSPGRADDLSLVLVVPPVLHPTMPPLGAHLLSSICTSKGITNRVIEANLEFAARVGFRDTGLIAASPPYRLMGEVLFLAAAFPQRAAEHREVIERLRNASGPGTVAIRWQAQPLSDELIERCLQLIPDLVADLAQQIVKSGARIVGFSTMGQQTVASIALARAVKRLDPAIITVVGGSNATEPMAGGILASTDAFDFAFSGEADVEFPKFCRAYLEHGKLPRTPVINCPPTHDLDRLPEPDYGAYFAALEPLRASDRDAQDATINLLFESSRGCWWGDRSLCKFCGYIPPAIGRYRVRTPDRIVAGIESLIERYAVRNLVASDTIMPARFPREVLPRLFERGVDCRLAYEIKSNHNAQALDACALAGIDELQPGIESLSSHVLALMDKGITALENIRFMRDARSRRIGVIWNFLTAFPGETRQDYETMIDLLPLIGHLDAPARYGPIHIARYSPYQRDPERYGIGELRPMPVYEELFGAYAADICCDFAAEYETEFTADVALVARFEQAVDRWVDAWASDGNPPCLELHPLPDNRGLIEDTREVAEQRWQRIDQDAIRVLSMLRNPVHREHIERRIDVELVNRVEELVEHKLVACYEGRYMSLVCEPLIGKRLAERRRERLQATGRRDPEQQVLSGDVD